MKPREIYEAAITFNNPPRIAMALPDPYPNDVISAGPMRTEPEQLQPEGNELRRWKDYWGVTWASLTDFDKGEVVRAPIEDWADLDSYVPPDLGRKEDYVEVARVFAADDEHFRIGDLPGLR